MKKKLNQKLINLIEYYNLVNSNYLFSNSPLNRISQKISATFSFSGTKAEKLGKLKKKIESIKNCELKKNANNLVFGDGNINSKIMIIGEGPGANEDSEGKPFVGRAGTLLDKMLDAIGLDRNKVYISNVVNYRPPENRKPSDKEIE
jgi:DNA polymerase